MCIRGRAVDFQHEQVMVDIGPPTQNAVPTLHEGAYYSLSRSTGEHLETT